MGSLAGMLVFFSLIVAGGSAWHVEELRSQATIYVATGEKIFVSVKNSGDYFCPRYCRVDHRHRVHDVRWVCRQHQACGHYQVLHIAGSPKNRSPQPQLALDSTVDLGPVP